MIVYREKTKSEKKLYVFVSIIGLSLAWIINKDVNIPSWITIGAAILATFFLVVAGTRKPEIAFYSLLGYLPFNKILSGSFGGFMTAINLTNILILINVFCYLAHNFSKRKRLFEHNWLNPFIFLFCLVGFFSVFRGGLYYGFRYIMEFIIPLKRWLTPIFLYFIALNMVKLRKVWVNSFVIIMIVVTIAGVLAIKESIDIGDVSNLDRARVGGIAQQPNMMGAFFVYYMFLFFGFFLLNWRKLKTWTLLIPFLICLRGIQVTFSRGALLAFTFGLTAIIFFKNKIFFIILCLGIVFALFNPQWLPGSMRYAIERTSSKGGQVFDNFVPLEEKVDRSAAIRLEIWRGSMEMIKENPWFGIGYGVFPFTIPMFTSGVGERDAHNTYIIIAAEMGVPALLIFLLIIFILYKNTLWLYAKVRDPFVKAIALGMLGGLAGMIVANMFGSRLESEEVSSYFWIIAGLIIRAVAMKKNKEIE